MNKKLIIYVLSICIMVYLIMNYLFCIRIIVSTSMMPTIKLKEIVIVYKTSIVHRGDVILFLPPKSQNRYNQEWTKRIIGLPGDVIKVENGNVYINNALLNEDYKTIKPTYDFSPYIIPDDSYFVLGDNRNCSNDSHIWGSLPKKNVLGIVLFK